MEKKIKVDNISLLKFIGKGSNSEVYFAIKDNDSNNYIVKRYERKEIEGSDTLELLKKEINLYKELSHPNIIQINDVKKTSNHFYIILDYYNGGSLSKILEKYQQNYGRPFSQEIIQHIMKQVVDVVKYLHKLNIVHNDIRLNSILVNFETEEDKNKLNLLKSQVKLGHFKFAGKSVNLLKKATILSDANKIQPKFTEKDKKIDIFHLGKICYQMLFGKYGVDSENMEKLIEEIEEGKFNAPITLSKEIISFLKDMLRMDPVKRSKINELSTHEFLEKNVKDFQLINEQKDNADISEEKDKNEEKEESDKKNLCVICYTNSNEIIISPCGHKCICEICYLKLEARNDLKNCPICKKPVESIVKKVYEV